MAELNQVLNDRRTNYALGNNTDITADDVAARLKEIAPILPSAMHSQTSRMVVVSGEHNTRVWEIIDEAQKTVMPEDMYSMMSGVFEAAKSAVGTVLFFESRDAVNALPIGEHRALTYKENNHAISAFSTWLTLTEMGLGASFQHLNVGYKQGFDKPIREELGLPDDFEMLAQMPFGSIEAPAGDRKPSVDADELVRSIG